MQQRRHKPTWVRIGVPLLGAGLLGALVAWLNAAPWWGWLLLGGILALSAFAARTWLRRPWFVRASAWLVVTGIVVGTAFAAGPVPTTRTLSGTHTDPVSTAQGAVVGVRDDRAQVDAFAGIPYAAPPVGPLRWRPPAPAPDRDSVLIADDFGPSAMQAEPTFLSRAATRLLDLPLEETLLGGYRTSEDSLRLNIWRASAPSTTGPRPILVYLHGGAFIAGSGAFPAYDGAALAARGDVIVVTLNYRLGVFGFLADDAIGGSTPGNQGLLDQLAALRWVQENIGAFGGDPNRVTVAGESAGSGSACILGASPLAAGLVHGIIGESGGCLGTAGDRDAGDLYDDRPTAGEAARELRAALGGATLEEMRAMPAERIASAAAELSAHWWPSVDDAVLPTTPSAIYAEGRQNDVPLLLGSNADETSLDQVTGVDSDPETYRREVRAEHGADADRFLELYPGGDPDQVVDSRLRAGTDESMTAPMREWALMAAQTGRSPVYTYFFSRVPPAKGLEKFGAYHGAEVMYAYGNLGADGDADYGAVDRRLESEMTASWLAFTLRQDPRNPTVERWPTVQESPEQVLEFGDATTVTQRPSPRAVDFWLDASARHAR